jgi:hypothetical protein
MRLEYTRSERRRKAAAKGILDNPEASPADKAQALKTLDHLEQKATRRANPQKTESQPADQPGKPTWMDGSDYNPTPAQQAVIDRLLEEGNEHEAEVWFYVYQMEAANLARNAEVPNV